MVSLNAGQKYYRVIQGEHSAILSIFFKLPFVIETIVLSIFEWPFTQVLLYFQFYFSDGTFPTTGAPITMSVFTSNPQDYVFYFLCLDRSTEVLRYPTF